MLLTSNQVRARLDTYKFSLELIVKTKNFQNGRHVNKGEMHYVKSVCILAPVCSLQSVVYSDRSSHDKEIKEEGRCRKNLPAHCLKNPTDEKYVPTFLEVSYSTKKMKCINPH